MKPIFITSFFLSLLLLNACKNTAAPTNQDKSNKSLVPEEKGGPDVKDLMSTLQGRWQSIDDSTYQIEIAEIKMKHLNGGVLSAETEIEVDAHCESVACVLDSTAVLSDGWCFIEKGQFDAQCNMVLKCDKDELRYTAIGSTGKVLAFVRKN